MKPSIKLAPLFTSRNFVAALLLGASIFSAAPAQANAGQAAPALHAGPTGASAKLPVAKPTVAVHSWNGRRITVVTPSPVNPRFPARGLDPMNVTVNGVHPDSDMEFMRQKQSHDVEITGDHTDHTDGELVKAAAQKAAHYVTMFTFKTASASAAQPHHELLTDAQKVAWPNSRVLVKGTTRDGQQIPHVTAVVDGTPDTRIQPYDAATRTVVNELISGRLLPSARAWIKADNLFVSEPTSNPKLVADGEELIRIADAKTASATQKQAEITAEQANAQQSKPVDQAKIKTLQTEIAQLQAESAAESKQGKDLVTRGNKITVRVLSAAGLPASASVSTVSVRARGENKPGTTHTASTITDEYDGFTAHEVEALHLDHLETTVSFAQAAGRAKSSTATVKFQVPAQSAKPAFTVAGVKYFRVVPTSSETRHEIADAQ